jgi:mannose/cellobiose epimerase-like protein (N-acyl-D-glucosamine 2-epimerase family)
MKRRHFFGAATAAGLGGALTAWGEPVARPASYTTGSLDSLPRKIAGMRLEDLLAAYRDRLFKLYLPFWEKGAYDRQNGGFMCELNDDGSVADDQKYIWYQGRGIWVYAFLYNHLDKKQRWLDVATRSRDFILRHMYAGQGKWVEKAGQRRRKLLKH